MNLSRLDISRLRQEAERDLEALKRVEAMLRRNGNSTGPSQDHKQQPPVEVKLGVNTGLKAKVGEIVKAYTVDGGLRPKDILQEILSDGYSFSTRAVAASAVSAALKRYGNKVQKKDDGHYVWTDMAGIDR